MLSLYLFLLCTEGLIGLLNNAVAKHLLYGIHIYQDAPKISHLLFANDCIFFGRATVDDVGVLSSFLQKYEMLSGQKVNFHKSEMIFNPNTSDTLRLSATIGVHVVASHCIYLGLPIMVGCYRRQIFYNIKGCRSCYKDGRNNFYLELKRIFLLKQWHKPFPPMLYNAFYYPFSLWRITRSMVRAKQLWAQIALIFLASTLSPEKGRRIVFLRFWMFQSGTSS